MHIAICDDNVADRKQTERLMGREADKWINEGNPLYIYTYGSLESLVANFMKFDAVFIDITQSNEMGTLEAVDYLKKQGLESNYIITSSTIDENTEGLPDMVDVLCKPFSNAGLHEILTIIDARRDPFDSRIELRGEHETVYAKEDDILYAEKDGFKCIVTLNDGSKLEVHDSLKVFYDEIIDLHDCYEYANGKYIVNAHHIVSFEKGKLTMTDGSLISVSFGNKKYIKKIMAE